LQAESQRREATGLVERLRQVLGPSEAGFSAPAGVQAENPHELSCQVAPDGAILGVSEAFAATLGVADAERLKGQPIGSYLPALAAGSLLAREIWERGEIRDVPVRLMLPDGGTERSALLSARVDPRDGSGPRMWTGRLALLPSTVSPSDARFFAMPVVADWSLLDQTRAEMQSEIEEISLQFPPSILGEVPSSLRSAIRIYTEFLPRLEAMLAFNTQLSRQEFDARSTLAGLCRASGRLLEKAGIDLIFDVEPAFPARVTACERRLTACAGLLLGAASAADDAREIVVRMAVAEQRFLRVEVCVRPARAGVPQSEQSARQIELANRLAATVDGMVMEKSVSPEYRRYVLRMGFEALDETLPLAGGRAARAANPALQALRVLIVSSGEGRSAVLAEWMRRQRADVTLSPALEDAQLVCRGVRPDIAILELPECPELPEFLSNVPILALRGSFFPAPDWCQTAIEKPVLEEELLEAVNALLPRLDLPAWELRPSASAGTGRILAVEDNLVNQRVIQKMLARLGYEVEVAANGLEAIAAIRTRAYDAILMDWEMPVMDGLEATAVIRQLPEPLCHLPVIAVTAHALRGDREACLNGGMNDYLSKPVDLDMLRDVLEKWLPCAPRRPYHGG